MRRLRQLTMVVASIAAIASGSALASSHREAPFIIKNPAVDGTDLYLFRSYETGRAAFTTVIANYIPFQDAFGGPNYFPMDPEALYEIHIDNDGNAQEDITFQFRFQNALQQTDGVKLAIGTGANAKQVAIPLINVGPGGTAGITAANNNGLNRVETYSVKVVRGNRRTGTAADVTNAAGGATTFRKPVDYIGTKSFGDANNDNSEYRTYADAHIYNVNIPGCTGQAKMFVGQRREPFAVNIGPIFDLVNAPLTAITTGSRSAVPNPLRNKNVTSIALEIPTTCLLQANQTPAQPVIGAWQTASVRQARVINPAATYARPSREGGAWTQVSRLGMPLVNEIVIGIKDKDRWNSSEPKDDGQFADYVTHPTLPALIQVLFPAAVAPNIIPRTDLVAVFLTGVPGVNAVTGGATAEMMRLNTAIAPTPNPGQNNLGAAACFIDPTGTPAAGDLKTLSLAATGCDPAGFPNGRRPGDDVTDVELRVVIGYLFARDADAPARGVPLHDAVLQDEDDFGTTNHAFPYLVTPQRGANGDGT